MKDREFLMWLHERLEHQHSEKPTYAYMHKLRAIIRDTPESQDSPNTDTGNSLEDIKDLLSKYNVEDGRADRRYPS